MKLLGLVLLALTCCVLGQDIVNTKVLRSIDLTTQFARHTINITAENKGSSTVGYSLAVQNASNLAFYKAETDAGVPLQIVQAETEKGYTSFSVNLGLAAGKAANFKVTLVYSSSLKPFPKEITMTSRQLVRYHSNAYFYSPYPTTNQRTTVKLASTHVEGRSEGPAPTKVSGDTVTYGSYADVKAFSSAPMWVHFENHAQFLTVTKMTKDYEVSHWGNLAVEQALDVRHDGAALKGHFSRIDFQRNPGGSPAAVLQITEILPNGASDVYYRDDIGNISTSTFSSSAKGLEFHIVPRFPLFGGWKNNWYTGYNLPLHNFLFTDSGSNYRLKVPFVSEFGNLFVEDYTAKIILPEGAKITKIDVPFKVERSDAKHFTYLDTTGRPVLVLHKRNVVPEHNVVITVEYQFGYLTKWHEPLLIAFAFFVLLSLVMVYVRFTLSIKPVDTTKTFQRRDEIITSLRNISNRVEAELARQNTTAEKATETTYRWIEKPSVLDELVKAANAASPVAAGEAFAARVRDYVDAQINRFKYQGKIHAQRFSTGTKKAKVEAEQKLNEKLRSAADTVNSFSEDWLAN